MADFFVDYSMSRRGLPTLFRHQYFTVDKKQRNNWDYDNLEQYLIEYKLDIDDFVIKTYKDNASVIEIIEELKEVDSFFIVSNNKSEYSGAAKPQFRRFGNRLSGTGNRT